MTIGIFGPEPTGSDGRHPADPRPPASPRGIRPSTLLTAAVIAGTFLFGGLVLWPEMGRGNPTGSITIAAFLVVVFAFLGIVALLVGGFLLFFERTRSLGRVLCAAGVGFLGAVFVAIKLD